MAKRTILALALLALVLGSHSAGADAADAPAPSGSDVTFEVGSLDLAVIVVYLVGIVGLGCWAGMRKRKQSLGSDYFLAGRSLTWPVIGLAMFATNISTIHLVSFAQNGYTSGLTYGNFEWMAAFTLVILSLFFAPFYIRSGVATLPDFMERRYSRGSRDYLAILSIFSAVVVHIGFSLYTGTIVIEGSVLRAFTDHPEHFRLWTVIGICGATALYTIVGGLLAVVLTESIQTVVLLAGAILITLMGLHMMGGAGESSGGLPGLGQLAVGWTRVKENVHPINLSMLRSDTDPTGVSWYAVFLGYPVLGVWYWCTDQTIVQRVLGAKDENHARVGPLFAGFIKILPVLIFVMPGIICLALVNAHVIPGLPRLADGSPDTEKTYSHLIASVLPVGARGIVVAALLAALMSTVSGALNSVATLFSYDIYKRFKPEADDRHLIRVGRLATFTVMCVAIAWTMAIGGQKSIFQMMVDVFPVVAPPTAVVFVWGVFWRRASATASLVTLIGGSVAGLVLFILNTQGLNKIGDYEVNALLQAFFLFVAESIGLVVLSLVFPHTHTAQSEALVWRSPLEALRAEGAWRGLLDFRVLAVLLVLTMVGLYVGFSSSTVYYPVAGQVTLDGKPLVGAMVYLDTDDDRLDAALLTDLKGQFTFGTAQRAGGAPAGTRYRARIVPDRDFVVRLSNDPTKAPEVLDLMPAGTPVVDHPDGTRRKLAIDEPGKRRTIVVDRADDVQLWRAGDVPARYRSFDSSELSFSVGEGTTTVDFALQR